MNHVKRERIRNKGTIPIKRKYFKKIKVFQVKKTFLRKKKNDFKKIEESGISEMTSGHKIYY